MGASITPGLTSRPLTANDFAAAEGVPNHVDGPRFGGDWHLCSHSMHDGGRPAQHGWREKRSCKLEHTHDAVDGIVGAVAAFRALTSHAHSQHLPCGGKAWLKRALDSSSRQGLDQQTKGKKRLFSSGFCGEKQVWGACSPRGRERSAAGTTITVTVALVLRHCFGTIAGVEAGRH